MGQPARPARDHLAARPALDGLPDRAQRPPPRRHAAARLRARAPGAGRRRAGRGRRGGAARLVRRGRRPRRAGGRAGLAARRGRAGRWGALPLPALPLPRDRARARARRRGLRLEPGLQRGARLRRRHRPPLPAVPGGRGAAGPPHPAAPGGDGHDAPFAPRARRGGGPRDGPGRARAGAPRAAAAPRCCGTTPTWPTTARPATGPCGATCSTSSRRAAPSSARRGARRRRRRAPRWPGGGSST